MRAHLRRCLYTVDSLKRLTHTLTHTRKRADGSSGNMGAKEYFSPSGNDQKRPENDIFRIFLLFVISRSGVRVRLPAPIFPQRSKVNMGEFPSGQRGQTVNLLSVTSVVRIHLPPPKIPNIRQDGRNFLILGEGGFERRLLATCRWHVATAVAFSAEKANPPSSCKFRADFRGEYRLSRSLCVLHSATLTPTLTPTAMGRNVPGWTK